MPQLVLAVGDYDAIVDVQTPGVVRLLWQDKNGKQLAKTPDGISMAHPDSYRQVRDKLKSIKKTLSVQTRRIESFYFEQSAMSLGGWQQSFARHNLMKTIAGNLIWRFQGAQGECSAMLHEGQLVLADGSPMPEPDETTTVALWHPLHSDQEMRVAWRNFIWQHSIMQPFRQAYRETYLASDIADIDDVVAGLYVRQHQFRSLLLNRGWRYQFRGNFETESAPLLQFSDGFSCEIGIGAESQSISGSAIALVVELTDIRFFSKCKQVSADEISPVLCSEVLRDIDLFTSVAGIGYRSDWEDMESVFAELVEIQLEQALASNKAGSSIILTRLLDENPMFSALIELLLRLEATVDAKPVTGVLKLRCDILTLLLGQSSLAGCTRVDGRNVFVDGPGGQHRINLASGLVFDCADNNLKGTVGKERPARLEGEAGRDILLAKIYRKIKKLAYS